MSKIFFVIRSIPETYSYVSTTYKSVSHFGSIISIPCKNINEYHDVHHLFNIIKNRVCPNNIVVLLSAGMVHSSSPFPLIQEYGYGSEKRNSYISSTVLFFKMLEHTQLTGFSKISIISSHKPEYYPDVLFEWNNDALRNLMLMERSYFCRLLLLMPPASLKHSIPFHSSLKSTSPDFVPLHKRGDLFNKPYHILTRSAPEYHSFINTEKKESRSLPESPPEPKEISTHDYVYYYYIISQYLQRREKEKLLLKILQKTQSDYYRSWCHYQLAYLKGGEWEKSISNKEPEHILALLFITKNPIYISEYENSLTIPIQRHRFRELLGFRYSIAPLISNPILLDKLLFNRKYGNIIMRDSFIDAQIGYIHSNYHKKFINLSFVPYRIEYKKSLILCMFTLYNHEYFALFDRNFTHLQTFIGKDKHFNKSTYTLKEGILFFENDILLNSGFYNFTGFELCCSNVTINKDHHILIYCPLIKIYRIITVHENQITSISLPLRFNINGTPCAINSTMENLYIATNKGYLYNF